MEGEWRRFKAKQKRPVINSFFEWNRDHPGLRQGILEEYSLGRSAHHLCSCWRHKRGPHHQGLRLHRTALLAQVFNEETDAAKAVEQLNASEQLGGRLRVEIAGQPKKSKGPQAEDECRYCGKLGHCKRKSKKIKKRRSSSSSSSSESSSSSRYLADDPERVRQAEGATAATIAGKYQVVRVLFNRDYLARDASGQRFLLCEGSRRNHHWREEHSNIIGSVESVEDEGSVYEVYPMESKMQWAGDLPPQRLKS
ncbi:unnamed protein product [Sphagnum balticum]